MYSKYKNRVTSFLTIVFVLLVGSTKIVAQNTYLEGPTTTTVGTSVGYGLNNSGDIMYDTIYWHTDGEILSGGDTGTYLGVLWNSADMYHWVQVDFMDGWDNYYFESLEVNVVEATSATPADPPNPTVQSSAPGAVILQRTGAPASGITWYWQTSASGTSTDLGSDSTKTVTSGNINYIRALNSAGTWSTGSGSVSYTVSPIPPISSFSDENYIHTTQYKVPTQNGTTNTITQAALTNNDKQQNITYFDGLGRPMQSVGIRAGGNAEDMITHIGYDAFGRQDKEFLPYTESSNGGFYRTGAEASTLSYYDAIKYDADFPGMSTSNAIPSTQINPYSQKEFEASPLNRVMKQAAPGKDWKLGNGHEIRLEYETNTNADQVKLFEVSFINGNTENPYLEDNGIYDPSELYKTITKDENWSSTQSYPKNFTTQEFKDKQGRVILKRTFDDYKWLDTYYVYDDYGNLTYVLPPKVFTYSSITQAYEGQYTSRSTAYGDNISFFQSQNDYTDFYMYKSGENSLYTYFYAEGISPGSILKSDIITLLDFSPKLPDMTLGDIVLPDINGTPVSAGTAKIENGYLKFESSGVPVYPTYGYLELELNADLSSGQANFSPLALDRSSLDDLIYQYKYDHRNRLIEKKLPGKEWEYIVYDKLDRPILTQDTNLKATNNWLFTKYDAFSRPVYTGEYENTTAGQTTRSGVQALADASAVVFESKQTVNTINGTTVYYSNTAFPNVANINLFTINYYDDYSFDLNGGVSATSYTIVPITNAKGLATGSKVRVLGTTDWITNVNYYDDKGRPIYNYSKNDYLATTSTVKNKLDFVGKTEETTSTHNRGTSTITVLDKFLYDQAGRLLTQTQAINGAATPEVIVANTYDELGQLTSKKVGGKNGDELQKVDYAYNIRGWLKNINDPNNLNQDNDLFAFGLHYNTIANTNLQTYYQNKPLYNGNISNTTWKTNNLSPILKEYNYTYDALNRFKTARYVENNSLNNKFNESINGYDRNGNIMGVSRNMQSPTDANSYTQIDNLNYTYDKGNKLLAVKDYVGLTTTGVEGFKDGNSNGNDYNYDGNGNMTKDFNKSIGTTTSDGITYNHLNLPTKITFPTGTIDYVYDATGVKQRKIVNPGVTTDYAGGFQYESNILKFFPQPEGYVEHNSGTFNYIYQYKDHLGNIRLSYADKDNNGTIAPAAPYTYQTIWEDGFESGTGWDGTGASWGHPLDAFDATVKHSGNLSGRIDVHNESSYRSRAVHSTQWIPIDNAVDTPYRVSGWFLIENLPQYSRGRLELMMKKAGETEYMTLYEYKPVTIRGQWVYMEMMVTVPAYIKTLNSRIAFDYGGNPSPTTGSAWYDDLKIEKATVNTQNEIVEENNYYPFGLKHKDGNNVVTSTSAGYKYKYQGQERQDELGLNWDSFKWRNYDPAIARFMNIDPLSEKYAYQSHYNFSENRVIDGRELEGLEVVLLKDTAHNKPIIEAANNGQYKDNPETKTIHVFAHGNPSAFFNENVTEKEKKAGVGTIDSGASMNNVLNQSELWKNSESKEGFTIVLHSCRTGKTTMDKDGNKVESVAEKISKEMPGVSIIAPDERDGFSANGNEIGPQVTKNTDFNAEYLPNTPKKEQGKQTSTYGNWNTFSNGMLIWQSAGNNIPKNVTTKK